MSLQIICAGWQMKRFPAGRGFSYEDLENGFENPGTGRNRIYEISDFPAQVHDVLLAYGEIKNPNLTGINEDLWIDDYDWVYRCGFSAETGVESWLLLEGIDTFADIYVNGVLVRQCEDVFLEYQIPVSQVLLERNTLLIHFHSAKHRMDEAVLPPKYQGRVGANSAFRVFRSGFHEYCGPAPSLIRCGIYGTVALKQVFAPSFKEVLVDTILEEDGSGRVLVDGVFLGDGVQGLVSVQVLDEDGRLAAGLEIPVEHNRVRAELRVERPQLWWPRTHGTPYLYKVELCCIGSPGESLIKSVGFRRITGGAEMNFTVNGRPLKLWGANLVHPDTMSNCYRPEVMNRLLDLAELGNFNALRVWGEGEKLPEAFYEECDRRGILIWQDFYLCCSLYSEEPHYLALCREEAMQLVKRLKSHPCILLWCGGNETLLCRDYGYPGEECLGRVIFDQVFAKVCKSLDPKRYYHLSSPSGGRWANDPEEGDTHGYTHLWFVPGREYPVFLSENCRVSAPAIKSMRRMMTEEELWPDGYSGRVTRKTMLQWPETWSRHNTNQGFLKLGPVEHYYDALSPEELVYNLGAAHGEYIREQVGRFRRGYSGDHPMDRRRTGGHLLWKFNNNSNIISYGVVDYFQEPYYPYYELKRCYEPFFLSCEFGDQGYLWITNDTPEVKQGILEVSLFDIQKNCMIRSFEQAFSVVPDESRPVCTLKPFGQFLKRHAVYARAVSDSGEVLGTSLDVFEIERHMEYPVKTGLSLIQEGDLLLVCCEAFARCVEVTAGDGGAAFGWLFEDNYFDLLPGMEKRIRILSGQLQGRITAKSVYDENPAVLWYQSPERKERE